MSPHIYKFLNSYIAKPLIKWNLTTDYIFIYKDISSLSSPLCHPEPNRTALQRYTATVERHVRRPVLTVHKNGFIKGSPCYFKPGESDHIQGCRDPGSWNVSTESRPHRRKSTTCPDATNSVFDSRLYSTSLRRPVCASFWVDCPFLIYWEHNKVSIIQMPWFPGDEKSLKQKAHSQNKKKENLYHGRYCSFSK